MASSPVREGYMQMQTRWPLGMPNADATGQTQPAAHTNAYARPRGSVAPPSEDQYHSEWPGMIVYPSFPAHERWQPVTQIPTAQYRVSPVHQAHVYSFPANVYPTNSAPRWTNDVQYEPSGFQILQPVHQQRPSRYSMLHHTTPPGARFSPDEALPQTLTQIPEISHWPEILPRYRGDDTEYASKKPEHVPFLTQSSEPLPTSAGSVHSPQALAGGQAGALVSEDVSAAKKNEFIPRHRPKRSYQDQDLDAMGVAKGPRVKDYSAPSCPGADMGMQEAADTTSVTEPNVERPHSATYANLVSAQSESTADEGARTQKISSGEIQVQANVALYHSSSEAKTSGGHSPAYMPQTIHRPTQPSPTKSSNPTTPRVRRQEATLQFSPRLYGREQPKRAATKKYQNVASPPRHAPMPKGGSVCKTLSQFDKGASNIQAAQLDGAGEIHTTRTRAAKRQRPAAKDQVPMSKRQRRELELPENSPVRGPPRVTRSRAGLKEDAPEGTALGQGPQDDDPFANIPVHEAISAGVPNRDKQADDQYVQAVIQACEDHVAKSKADTFFKISARRIAGLLRIAKFASDEEAKFLTKAEAEAETASNKFFNGPIITQGQQTLPLQSVDDFLGEYYEPDAKVHVQDSSVKIGKTFISVRPVRVKQVRERLAGAKSSQLPWNCLELATHHSDGLRPSFLQNEDCRLLTKLKIPDSADEARRKTYGQGYKEIESWALLAQAGALTEPHQDSHGYSTFITINEGIVGFGWLSNPSREEREGWRKNPQEYSGGNWRYVVLKPGQTIYFPAGTVHMVFRLPSAGHTLAFGGHVLRCSNIVHWVETLIEERDHPNVTNEDLLDSSTGYLARVERFVNTALETDTAAKFGGKESIERFLELKKEFLRRKQKQTRI